MWLSRYQENIVGGIIRSVITSKNKAKLLTKLVLAVFIVSMQVAVLPTYAQQNPITIDGTDRDWVNWVNKNGEPWVCPAGRGCRVPTTPKTAWLCCNTTSIPRECQVIWRDGREDTGTNDLDILRLYIDSSYLYIYANISNPLIGRFWRLNISLGSNIIEVRVLITWYWFWYVVSTNVYINGVDRTSSVVIGTRYTYNALGLELRIPRGLLNPLAEEVVFATRTRRRTTVYDLAEVSDPVNQSIVYEYTRLRISGDRVVDGYFGYTDIPIPIPEPGVVLSFVVLSVVAISLAVSVRDVRRRT